MKYLFILLIPFIISCSGSNVSKDKKKLDSISAINIKKNIKSNSKLKSSTNALTTKQIIFVINEQGADLYKKPNSKSAIITRVNYGQAFEIVNSFGEWYGINCTDNSKNSNFYFKSQKVLYVNKDNVVEDTNVPLSNLDLNKFQINYREGYYDGDSSYKDIKVSFVSKEQFYKAKKLSFNYFTADTLLANKKKKTILSKVYDHLKQTDDEDKYKYSYIGQIKDLNCDVIRKEYFGDYGDDPLETQIDEQTYILINSKTGKEFKSLESFPQLSYDKRLLISFRGYIYLNRYSVAIRDLINDKIYISEIFDKWVVADESLMFWGTDNHFYLAVLPGLLGEWAEKGKRVYEGDVSKYRYVKIQIPPLSSFKN